MRYLVTKEIKSETQVIWKLYLQDFVFLSVWIFLCLNLQENVHKSLEIPYLIFFRNSRNLFDDSSTWKSETPDISGACIIPIKT